MSPSPTLSTPPPPPAGPTDGRVGRGLRLGASQVNRGHVWVWRVGGGGGELCSWEVCGGGGHAPLPPSPTSFAQPPRHPCAHPPHPPASRHPGAVPFSALVGCLVVVMVAVFINQASRESRGRVGRGGVGRERRAGAAARLVGERVTRPFPHASSAPSSPPTPLPPARPQQGFMQQGAGKKRLRSTDRVD